jgi:hypothetical protein
MVGVAAHSSDSRGHWSRAQEPIFRTAGRSCLDACPFLFSHAAASGSGFRNGDFRSGSAQPALTHSRGPALKRIDHLIDAARSSLIARDQRRHFCCGSRKHPLKECASNAAYDASDVDLYGGFHAAVGLTLVETGMTGFGQRTAVISRSFRRRGKGAKQLTSGETKFGFQNSIN